MKRTALGSLDFFLQNLAASNSLSSTFPAHRERYLFNHKRAKLIGSDILMLLCDDDDDDDIPAVLQQKRPVH